MIFGIIEGSAGVVSVDSFAAHVDIAFSRLVAVLMVAPYSEQQFVSENMPIKTSSCTRWSREIDREILVDSSGDKQADDHPYSEPLRLSRTQTKLCGASIQVDAPVLLFACLTETLLLQRLIALCPSLPFAF